MKWRKSSAVAVAVLELAFGAGTALAEEKGTVSGVWVVTTADGAVREARVKALGSGVGGGGVMLGDGTEIGAGTVVRLERGGGWEFNLSGLVLSLRDGQRLPGDPAAAGPEELGWISMKAGAMRVPLKAVARVERFGAGVPAVNVAGDAAVESGQTEDVVVLLNGDRVRGVVSKVTAEGVVVLAAGGGEAQTVGWAAIRVLSLADLGGNPGPVGETTRVELVGGTVLRATGFEIKGREVSFHVELGERRVAMAEGDVVAIEWAGGAVWPLTMLQPTAVEHVPFLSAVRGPRFDASAGGGPLKSGDRVVRRGIGITALTRVSYAVPDGFTRLRVGLAMDGSAERGSAVFRVVSGETVLFEETDVAARGRETAAVSVDLKGAKTVTLEVDFGTSAGVQARVNLVDPMFLRQ